MEWNARDRHLRWTPDRADNFGEYIRGMDFDDINRLDRIVDQLDIMRIYGLVKKNFTRTEAQWAVKILRLAHRNLTNERTLRGGRYP